MKASLVYLLLIPNIVVARRKPKKTGLRSKVPLTDKQKDGQNPPSHKVSDGYTSQASSDADLLSSSDETGDDSSSSISNHDTKSSDKSTPAKKKSPKKGKTGNTTNKSNANKAIVGGLIWPDSNGDGYIQTLEQAGIPDVVVALVREIGPGKQVEQTTTSSDGTYKFVLKGKGSLRQSRFYIQVYPRAGWGFTLLGDDSNVDGNGISESFQIEPGETRRINAGLFRAWSIQIGTLTMEWDESTLISFDEMNPLICADSFFDVFFGISPFSFENKSIPELILQSENPSNGLQHIVVSIDELGLTVNDLDPDTYSILVTANANGRIFSDNRESVDISIATVDPQMNVNVTAFLGSFESSVSLSIIYGNETAFDHLIINGDVPDDFEAAEIGNHLAVITDDDENFLLRLESIIQNDGGYFIAEVSEATLVDVLQQLDLDVTADTGREIAASPEALVRRRRKLLTITIFDRTLTIDESIAFGPLTVRGKVELRAYLRIRVTIRFSFFSGVSVSARATLGGSLNTLGSITYAAAATHSISFNRRVWTGPRIRITFTVFAVPVWINLRPKVDVSGAVSVELEGSAKVEVTQAGSISMSVYYEGGWGSSNSKSFSQSIDTDVSAKATATAEVGAVLTLSTNVYGLVGVDLGLNGGLMWEAVAEASLNALLELFHFTKFDADAFVKAPVTGTSIFGNYNFGNLFELDFPLLKLPDVSLVKDSVISCNGDIAIELKAHAEAKEYTLPIANNIGATYDWIDDWNPEGPTTTDRVAQLYQTVEDSTAVTLKLLRSAIGDPDVDFYSIPVGTLVFETTADIPKLDEKIKFSETMTAIRRLRPQVRQ
eukprot:scaffold55719_cov86-Attheya_sp.AAC.3